MITIRSSTTQYALLPLSFANADGAVLLQPGSLRAEAPTGGSASIVETANEDGSTSFAARLVTPDTAGDHAFRVLDNTPDGDGLTINALDVTYTTTTESVVNIEGGTPEFRPKSEL